MILTGWRWLFFSVLRLSVPSSWGSFFPLPPLSVKQTQINLINNWHGWRNSSYNCKLSLGGISTLSTPTSPLQALSSPPILDEPCQWMKHQMHVAIILYAGHNTIEDNKIYVDCNVGRGLLCLIHLINSCTLTIHEHEIFPHDAPSFPKEYPIWCVTHYSSF